MKKKRYKISVQHRSHPIGHFLKPFIKRIDEDARLQLKIHTFGFWYWTINFPIVTYLFFFQVNLWIKYGLFITLIYSIYANWTSDYTGMSSSQSVINTERVEITDSDVSISVEENNDISS